MNDDRYRLFASTFKPVRWAYTGAKALTSGWHRRTKRAVTDRRNPRYHPDQPRQADQRNDMTFHNAGPAHLESASPDGSPADMKPSAGLMKRRQLLTSAAVVLTATTGVTAAHAATAAVSEPTLKQPDAAATSFDAAFWHRQDRLVDLRGWTEDLPGLKTSGYVISINNEPVDGSVVLVWHGPPDPVQRQIIDEARRRDIPVSVQQRKHTMADLERATNQIFAIESGTGEFHNFKISGAASFSIDFDGVTVIGEYIYPPAEGIAAADTALTRALTARTGVAVTIEHGEIVPL